MKSVQPCKICDDKCGMKRGEKRSPMTVLVINRHAWCTACISIFSDRYLRSITSRFLMLRRNLKKNNYLYFKRFNANFLLDR